MAKFKPSKKSVGSKHLTSRSKAQLAYARKAIALIEVKDEELPVWVQAQLLQSAQSLGIIVSYLQREKRKKSE